MSGRFVAERPWKPVRPTALVICCSDGRYHEHIEEFLHHEVPRRPDLYAVPGGAAGFDWYNSSFEEARATESAIRLLLEHHSLEKVWLVAHEGCAYYGLKYRGLQPEERRERQWRDLRRAEEYIRRWSSGVDVYQVFVTVEDGQVVFTSLDGPGTTLPSHEPRSNAEGFQVCSLPGGGALALGRRGPGGQPVQ